MAEFDNIEDLFIWREHYEQCAISDYKSALDLSEQSIRLATRDVVSKLFDALAAFKDRPLNEANQQVLIEAILLYEEVHEYRPRTPRYDAWLIKATQE